MARIHGVAGEWARVRGTVLGLWPLFLGIFSAGFAVALMLAYAFYGLLLLIVSLIGISASLMFGLKRIERFFKGARGEEKIAGILAALPDAYHVFNDFTVGRNHVDHVVAGPGGVFAVETKCWRGNVTIEDGDVLLDGRFPDRSPLEQAIREATLVRSALAVLGWAGVVTPVLAFASDTFAAHRAEVNGVVVINASELQSSFKTDRVVIPPAELERLVRLMESNA